MSDPTQAQAEDRRARIDEEAESYLEWLREGGNDDVAAAIAVLLAELSRLSRVEQALQPFMRRWMDNPEASTYLWTLVQEYEPELPFSGRRQEMLDAVTALETALSASPEAQPEVKR